jgi:hypothetical protein
LLVDSEGTGQRRYRLFLLHIYLHVSVGGDRVCGVAQYVPMRWGRDGSGQGRNVAGKRKAGGGLGTELDLDSWMLEVGVDDSMLDELLNLG